MRCPSTLALYSTEIIYQTILATRLWIRMTVSHFPFSSLSCATSWDMSAFLVFSLLALSLFSKTFINYCEERFGMVFSQLHPRYGPLVTVDLGPSKIHKMLAEREAEFSADRHWQWPTMSLEGSILPWCHMDHGARSRAVLWPPCWTPRSLKPTRASFCLNCSEGLSAAYNMTSHWKIFDCPIY